METKEIKLFLIVDVVDDDDDDTFVVDCVVDDCIVDDCVVDVVVEISLILLLELLLLLLSDEDLLKNDLIDFMPANDSKLLAATPTLASNPTIGADDKVSHSV